MMELVIDGKPSIACNDNGQDVIFDKRIAQELNEIKDANGNKIDFIEDIND